MKTVKSSPGGVGGGGGVLLEQTLGTRHTTIEAYSEIEMGERMKLYVGI